MKNESRGKEAAAFVLIEVLSRREPDLNSRRNLVVRRANPGVSRSATSFYSEAFVQSSSSWRY